MYTNGKCKVAAAICYLSPLGWLIAYFLREKSDSLSLLHLNQALPLVVIEAIATSILPGSGVLHIIGEIIDLAVVILSIIGIIRALKNSDKPLPLVGDHQFIK